MGFLSRFVKPSNAVDARTAHDLLQSGALLLDVREASEWKAGHVSGAVHVPLGRLRERVRTLPSERRIVVACRSGNRSAQATSVLRSAGLDAVNLSGGLRAWHAAGLALQAVGGGPGRVA